MAKAFKISGLSGVMDAEVFAKTLAGQGYKPVCVISPGQARPSLYRLKLPEAGAGVVPSRDFAQRLQVLALATQIRRCHPDDPDFERGQPERRM